MIHKLNPSGVVVPVPNYIAGTLVKPESSWVYTSGQVGIDKEGNIPRDFSSQCSIAMDNVMHILKEGQMGPENIVKLTFFLINRDDLMKLREIRDEKMNGIYVASTVLVVSGFVLSELKIEIDCVAAK